MLNEGYQFIFSSLLGPRLPGARHHAVGPVVQPRGRRAARLARPGAAQELEPRGLRAQVPAGPAQPESPAARSSAAQANRRTAKAQASAAARSKDLLSVDRSARRVPDRGPVAPGDGGRHLHVGTRQDPRPGGRERLGQDRLGPGHHGAPAAEGLPGQRDRLASRAATSCACPPAELRQVRGNEIAMIFQEPMTSLNPAFTVGNQIAEQVRTHRKLSKAESWKVAVEMLERVEIPVAGGTGPGLSARLLRGHAPAGDDRHGALVLSQAADRRRAHDRPRRHHPGADRRAAPHPAARGGDGHDLRDPRPRGHRRRGRRRRRDVRRPDRRAHRGRPSCSPGPVTPTPRRCSAPCPSSTPAGERAALHPRHRPATRPAPRRVPLPSALLLRRPTRA